MGRLMRMLAATIMQGRWHAITVIALGAMASLLVPPLSWISAAGIGLITLRRGPNEGLFVLLGAGFLLSLVAFVTLNSTAPGIAFAIMVGLPTGLLALVLRNTTSLSLTLCTAGLMGILLIVGVHLLGVDTQTWWRGFLDMAVKPALQQSTLFENSQQLELWLTATARIMTGLVAAAMVFSLIVSLLVARWWQAILYNPGGFRQEFHGLRIARSLAVPALVVLAAAVLTKGDIGQFATEIMAVLLVLYTIQGLALAHRTVARRGLHFAWLVAVYAALLLVSPYAIMVVAALGLADSWFYFNGQQSAQDDSKPG